MTAKSLWTLWNDTTYLSKEQRLSLNAIEPFDEWEEFVLFASHYFLLIAERSSSWKDYFLPEQLRSESPKHCEKDFDDDSIIAKYGMIPQTTRRRFGAVVQLSPGTVGHHGGLSLQSRVDTMDIYSISQVTLKHPNLIADGAKILPRMCHTVTHTCFGSILIGGRASPNHALKDCWLLTENRWHRSEDLPIPLFRHSATAIPFGGGGEAGVLVYGGKTEANLVSEKWLLWRECTGWVEVFVTGYDLRPRFGAAMISIGDSKGLMLGGMENDGTILDEVWEWSLTIEEELPRIAIRRPEIEGVIPGRSVFQRIGACLSQFQTGYVLVGGVASNILPQHQEIVYLARKPSDDLTKVSWELQFGICPLGADRPLLVGHSTIALQESFVILGGGAVCFSFGTYWNSNVIILSSTGNRIITPLKNLDHNTQSAEPVTSLKRPLSCAQSSETHPRHENRYPIGTLVLASSQEFKEVIDRRGPAVIKALYLGKCMPNWTLQTLRTKIGHGRNVGLVATISFHTNVRRLSYTKPKTHIWIFNKRTSATQRSLLASS